MFVQWTCLLNSIKEMLQECNIPVSILQGNTVCQNAALKKFKLIADNPQATSILLSSVNNTGLDLVNANHLIFVHSLVGEDYMIKAMEDQAIARIHRTGQTKQVHVYWMITRGTIEEQTYLATRVV